jgi:hypothetical protein
MTTNAEVSNREQSYTISEFCALERISHPTFYKLKGLGLAPREMRGPLNTVRISHAARLDWQAMMEKPSDAAAKTAEAIRKRAQAAVRKSAASPNHISRKPDRRRRRQPAVA